MLYLVTGLKDKVRTLYTDKWYISVQLAKSLLDKKIDLIGTAQKNRKSFPKEVKALKLKKKSMLHNKIIMELCCLNGKINEMYLCFPQYIIIVN